MMTMMTMMAVFNPLNFGVWGFILAPVAALVFGGMCFAMYHVMPSQGWSKPQEIIVKNRVNHSPIPIKILHLHKKVVQQVPVQHVPIVFHRPKDYGPDVHDSYGPPPPSKSYGEPPMIIDDYHPSAGGGGGPYQRQSTNRLRKPVRGRRPTVTPKNSYKFKLL